MCVVLCLAAFLIEILVPRLIMGEINKAESPRDLALKAMALAGPDTRFVTVGPMQALSWYTGRRVLVVGDPGELEFGSRQGDNSAWFPDPSAFSELWSGEQHVLMFLNKSELDYLKTIVTPPPVIKAESGQRLLISNR
jgi:hypothetical protein